MHLLQSLPLAFTLLELVVAIVIIAVVILGIIAGINGVKSMMNSVNRRLTNVTGAFVTPPPTIAKGTSVTVVFAVTGIPSTGGARVGVPNRTVAFSAPSNQLTVSPTQAATDSAGNISVIITAAADYTGTATVTNTDVNSGNTGTTSFTVQ